MYGEVIGITTAKYSGTTGSGASIEGIGFAIPIDDVEPLISDLIDYGYVTGAYMAVTVQDMDSKSADMFGLPTGAYIVSTEPGGAADRAGIQAKDIVIGIDSHAVSNVTELTRALRNYKAGDTATVKLIRSGREMTLEIVFDERPQQLGDPAPQQPSSMPNEGSYDEWFDYFRRFFGG
jgi:serine protease Do